MLIDPDTGVNGSDEDGCEDMARSGLADKAALPARSCSMRLAVASIGLSSIMGGGEFTRPAAPAVPYLALSGKPELPVLLTPELLMLLLPKAEEEEE